MHSVQAKFERAGHAGGRQESTVRLFAIQVSVPMFTNSSILPIPIISVRDAPVTSFSSRRGSLHPPPPPVTEDVEEAVASVPETVSESKEVTTPRSRSGYVSFSMPMEGA